MVWTDDDVCLDCWVDGLRYTARLCYAEASTLILAGWQGDFVLLRLYVVCIGIHGGALTLDEEFGLGRRVDSDDCLL